jgi:hypothetical protein
MNNQPKILLKKQSESNRNFKSEEDLKLHFIERLNERYCINGKASTSICN